MNIKRRLLTVLSLTALFLMSSCIKKEAKNTEADILTCKLPERMMKTPASIENKTIMMMIVNADKTDLAPEFTLTPGATIEPASGTVRDFTTPQLYTVTSEDGKWKKEYTVMITDSDIPTKYGFDNWSGSGKYENPYEVPRDHEGNPMPGKMQIWSSGNAGYVLVGGKEPADFPTCSSQISMNGLAAKLETKATGFDALPIAAGNLFLGMFDGKSAMSDPLKATRFGVPFAKKPKKFSGYYKYKPGPVYKKFENDKQIEVPGKVDECHIYVVYYYKNKPGGEDSGELLHGGNVTTSDRIIAFAEAKTKTTESYTRFEVEFNYEDYPTEFDEALMKDYKYYLGVVFSASKDGAKFSGAVGSLLFVDEVEVECF